MIKKKILIFFNFLTQHFSENREVKGDSGVGRLVITKWLEGKKAEKLFLWCEPLTSFTSWRNHSQRFK